MIINSMLAWYHRSVLCSLVLETKGGRGCPLSKTVFGEALLCVVISYRVIIKENKKGGREAERCWGGQ